MENLPIEELHAMKDMATDYLEIVRRKYDQDPRRAERAATARRLVQYLNTAIYEGERPGVSEQTYKVAGLIRQRETDTHYWEPWASLGHSSRLYYLERDHGVAAGAVEMDIALRELLAADGIVI